MRTRLALLLAGALVLGACGNSDDGSDAASPDTTATEGATDGATGAPTEGGTDAAPPELVSEDLPDGVAATVGDTEIQTADLEERLALIREIPEMKKQLEGENSAQVESQLTTQVLGQMVLQEVVLQGAADEGVEVDDDQVAKERQTMTEQAGGADAFAEQLASSGVPEDQVADQIRAALAFELVTEQLLAEAGVDPSATDAATDAPSEGGTGAPSEGGTEGGPDAAKVQQEWLLSLVGSADVVVDQEYGAWNPQTGQVVPA